MRIYKAILLTFLFLFIGLFWGYEIWNAIKQHWLLFIRWCNSARISYYPWYLWIVVGASVFPIMNRYFVKNMELIKTFTHELTHTITNLLFFRRVHSFHASEHEGGVVWSSGNNKLRFMTSLAPYCFPIYTIPLLMFRCMVNSEFLPIIDVFIGFSIGIHLVCFIEQTRNYQPDINQFPLWFSYIYILSVWLFDISTVLMTYIPNSNFFLVFKTYAIDIWNLIIV